MEINYTLEQLIKLLEDATVVGKAKIPFIKGIAPLDKAQTGDLSFLGNPKYNKEITTSKASVILVPLTHKGEPAQNQIWLRVQNPSLALGVICRAIEKDNRPKPSSGIHPSAVVEPTAIVDDQAYIGPFCYVGPKASIGAGCVLISHVHIGQNVILGADVYCGPHVSILHDSQIGDRVYLDAGVTIGSEGYGYEQTEGRHVKLSHIGRVVIESDVDIGAHSTIDRGRLSETHIGKGTKIDNQVQIGHNVVIGKHCLIVAFTGIAGSTSLGDYVIAGGQTGIAGHLKIGSHVMIAAQSGINKDLPPKSYVRGTPAYSFMEANRVEVLTRRLPEIYKRLCTLEDHLKDNFSDLKDEE
jgi:UDP-3-O-[3-hydroxymyristoyl] glucosamine N-acyltransferase